MGNAAASRGPAHHRGCGTHKHHGSRQPQPGFGGNNQTDAAASSLAHADARLSSAAWGSGTAGRQN